MKLIININEGLYKATVNGLDANEIWNLRMAVANGTPIPDNATNGDIEQMMFPDAEVNGETDLTVSFSIDSNTAFTKKWWNAPYQKGGKE